MGQVIDSLEGVILTPLKIIPGELGSVFHGMKHTDPGFHGFGEVYFSTVHQGVVKGWKKHTEMVLNVVVPVGSIRFVIYDDREHSATIHHFQEVVLSTDNYYRLTVPPGLWMAFQGVGPSLNLLMNAASIPHDPAEAINDPISTSKISFDFQAYTI